MHYYRGILLFIVLASAPISYAQSPETRHLEAARDAAITKMLDERDAADQAARDAPRIAREALTAAQERTRLLIEQKAEENRRIAADVQRQDDERVAKHVASPLPKVSQSSGWPTGRYSRRSVSCSTYSTHGRSYSYTRTICY